MIALACKLCGCRDLKPAGIRYTAICTNCGEELQLWQMSMVCVQADPEHMQASVSEISSPNLAQLDTN